MIYTLASLALLFMNFLDVLYTKDIIDNGGSEVNPVAWYIIQNFGFTGLTVYKVSFCLFIFMFSHVAERGSKFMKILFWTPVFWYSILTVYHLVLKFG